MISDTKIHLFLRNMLLDGLAANNLDVFVWFENIHKKNLPNTFIIEQLIPMDEDFFTDGFETGEGLYKLTVFDDVGGGLKITTITDALKSIFKIGTHVVDEENHIALCIDKVYSNESLYEDDSDKVQKSIAIQYRKIYIN